MGQIVYTRIFGLSGDEAAQKLLAAVGHVDGNAFASIADWPGDKETARDEVTTAITNATPQGRRVEIDRSSGKVSARTPDERPTASAEVGNDAVLDNLCRKVGRRTERFLEGALSNQYAALRDVCEMLKDAIENGAREPLRLHDDFEQAVREIEVLIRVGNLPDIAQAPELAALRNDLRNGVADLRRVFRHWPRWQSTAALPMCGVSPKRSRKHWKGRSTRSRKS